MKGLKEFVIQFIGLKEGEHKFEYQIDSKFFDEFQYDEYEKASLKVDLVFVKKTTLLELSFSVSGTVNVPCDVSGEMFDLSINGEMPIIVKFGEEDDFVSEEIVFIPHSSHQINVSHYIYELIVFSVPAKRIHPKVLDGTIDSEVLEQLEAYKVKKNKKKEKETDPRWGKLKNLLIDKNHRNGTSKEKNI